MKCGIVLYSAKMCSEQNILSFNSYSCNFTGYILFSIPIFSNLLSWRIKGESWSWQQRQAQSHVQKAKNEGLSKR